MPECQRSPRGPNGSPSTGAVSGQASGSGIAGGGAVSAPSVAGPATPSAFSPAQSWKRRKRRVDVRAEDPVEGARRKAVLGELELERRDVPAGVAEIEAAAAEPVAAKRPRARARLRADDAVDGDVRALLEAADRLCGRRAGDAVDRALVEPMRAQADLKGGDARIGRRGAGG